MRLSERNAQNDIPSEQARPELVALIRARDRTYRAAKFTQGTFVLLSILLPIAGVLLGANYPSLKPFLTLSGLILLLVDTAYLDRLQKARIKRGAKLQEEFDTTVLQLPWNRFVAGAKVDPEDVRAASGRPLSQERESQIVCWYEPCVGEVPIQLARLICQRTNISYDARLRRTYGTWLLYGTVALGIILSFVGIAFNLTLSGLLLAVVVPLMPILNWALREHHKQTDTANYLVTLKGEFEKLWEKALKGTRSRDLDRRSRELQDAIYQHRASSPLVFDWVYYRLRNRNEDEAQHAAKMLVQQAKESLTLEVDRA
ncbi:MAG: hypothetical protein K9L32_06710 [Chromatiaceae bacterium]|nr:hypothetical protein [Chromatiaceae bacterium]